MLMEMGMKGMSERRDSKSKGIETGDNENDSLEKK